MLLQLVNKATPTWLVGSRVRQVIFLAIVLINVKDFMLMLQCMCSTLCASLISEQCTRLGMQSFLQQLTLSCLQTCLDRCSTARFLFQLMIFITITWYIFTILFRPPGPCSSPSLLVNQQIKLQWAKFTLRPWLIIYLLPVPWNATYPCRWAVIIYYIFMFCTKPHGCGHFL